MRCPVKVALVVLAPAIASALLGLTDRLLQTRNLRLTQELIAEAESWLASALEPE